MTNLITAFIGIAMVLVFLGVMLWWVKALPLFLIVAVVMFLLLVDFVQSLHTGRNTSGR